MMYLVDFYGTLFNAQAFEEYERIEGPGPYAPGALSQFLYQDAAAFLREKENSVLVVTSMDKAYGEQLIENALHGIPRMSVMYTNGTLKGEHLAPYIGLYGASPVFVDDSIDQLASMALHCPTAQLFEMRRDDQMGDGRWPVVHTFSQLP